MDVGGGGGRYSNVPREYATPSSSSSAAALTVSIHLPHTPPLPPLLLLLLLLLGMRLSCN